MGVPQGSDIEPPLFNICSKDIVERGTKLILYADNTTLNFTLDNVGSDNKCTCIVYRSQ